MKKNLAYWAWMTPTLLVGSVFLFKGPQDLGVGLILIVLVLRFI